MATIEELYEGIRRAGAAGDANAVQVLGAELQKMQSQQPAAGPSPYAENVGMLEKPIEFQGQPAEKVGATLGTLVPPPELAADLLKVKSPQGGTPTEANVQAISAQLERTGSIRDVLNKEVASGALSPTATLDPQQYPVLAPIWEQYKKEMQPSMAGAAARGAISQVGPTIGGLAGGAGGSMLGPVGAIGGGIAGGAAGGAIQQGIMSEFQTPQEQSAAQAQAAFDEARARGSRAIGEALPMAATLKPALGTIQRAFAGDAGAIAQVAIGSALGGVIPAAFGGGAERAVVGAVTGGVLQPRQMTGTLMQRPLRTEAKAQQVARNIVQDYATGVPEALAMRLESAPSSLTASNVTPLAPEISGNGGLIALGNALSNLDTSLRDMRLESRAALSKNIGSTLRQQGASFEQAEQFFAQQNQNLLNEAQRISESLIQAGDQAGAKIISDSLSKSQAARTAQEGVVNTAEKMLENTQQALESARAKLSARGGVKNQASVVAKTVLNEERDIEKAAVNKLYDSVKVAGLKSNADNTYKAALEAKGAKGAGLWGDLPDPIQRIITTLTPPKKGAKPEVSVQDLMAGIRTLNGKIRSSVDPNEQRILTMVKDGLDADIQALGKTHSDLAVANAAYSSYASRYKDRAAKNVFNKFGGTEDSKTIDAFLGGSIELVRQLKDALKGRPEGTQAVQDWIVNDLAAHVGETATPANINAWLSKRNVEGWIREFPEALPTINAYLQDVSKATEAIDVAGTAVGAAKQRLKTVKSEGSAARSIAGQEDTVVRAAANRAAALQVKQAQETVANSAAAKVIGKDPIEAITSVLQSGNAERAAKQLSDLAATDKTGKATEGLKNAVRAWMNEQRVRFGEMVSTLEDPTKTASYDDLATSFAGMNKMLVGDTKERKVIEAILGKNSRELNEMNIYRGQLEIMERFRRPAAGQSVTSLNTALKEEFNDKMANNLLGFLGKIAYGTMPEGMRYGAIGSATRALGELASKLSWSGDPSGRARAIMIEGIKDKKLMAQLLRPLDKNNLPEAKAFVKTYLVPQVPNQPQQESK